MSDWKHEQGYEEPKECGFCEQFKGLLARGAVETVEGTCWRGLPPFEEMEFQEQRVAMSERKCNARGACRYFMRKK